MKTKYNIVKDSIKSKILDGSYQPNQKINSESELMKQFGVSRHTVRLAIGDLVTEGWLYRKQGSGTFCANRKKQENQKKFEQQSKNIAIITTFISDYIFPSIIRGAEEYLSENGYTVNLFSTNNDHETEKKVLEKIISGNFDGVIVEPTKSAFPNPNINYYLNIERLGIPYVMINASYEELEPYSISIDDEKGGYLQAEHLIKLGHKNIIGFFKVDDLQGKKRLTGFLKAHRVHNIPINPTNIVTYNTDEIDTKPKITLENFLSNNKELPMGLVCYNDQLAIKLLDVIRKDKLEVPNDISIVGFDDSFMAVMTEVKLTSIKHPKADMGIQAATMITNLINNNKEKQDKNFTYDAELIVRKSTKKN